MERGWVVDPAHDPAQPGDPHPLPGVSAARLTQWFVRSQLALLPVLVGLVVESYVPWGGWPSVMLVLGLLLVVGGQAVNRSAVLKRRDELSCRYTTFGWRARQNPQLYYLDPQSLAVRYRPPASRSEPE